MSENIYHITEKTYFDNQIVSGEYFSPTFDTEKFIHLSTKNQVKATLDRYYLGKKGLILLEIDSEKIKTNLKYELASNGELFPHLYAPLLKEVIINIEKIS
jgi:uncharacterized protein (DUF952 family)